MKLSWKKAILMMVATCAAWRAAGEIERDITQIHHPVDPREVELRQFLHKGNCPAESSASVFLAEADEHRLDWRLLPSLAFVESTGGKFAHHNNIFGWANGVSRFATRREAIHSVAKALAEAPAYKGKDLKGKLWAFNQSE